MSSHGFPQFADGDVEIWLSSDEKLVLRSTVLLIHSTFFKAALTSRWADNTPLPTTSADTTSESTSLSSSTGLFGGKQRYSFELRFEKASNDGQLYRKGVDPTQRFDTSTSVGDGNVEASASDTEICHPLEDIACNFEDCEQKHSSITEMCCAPCTTASRL